MCGCESWTTKKAECPRIDAFELWCWRRLLRVPCTARRSNQSILKKINPGYSLAVLMVKLKLHTLATWFLKNWLIRRDSDAGNDWRQEEKWATEDETVGWHHWLDGHEFEQALGVGDEQGSLACCSPWGHKELDTTEQLKWTELNCSGIQQVSEGPNVYIATSDWPSNLERYSVKWEFYLSFKTYYLLNIQTTLIYIYLYLTTPPHKKDCLKQLFNFLSPGFLCWLNWASSFSLRAVPGCKDRAAPLESSESPNELNDQDNRLMVSWPKAKDSAGADQESTFFLWMHWTSPGMLPMFPDGALKISALRGSRGHFKNSRQLGLRRPRMPIMFNSSSKPGRPSLIQG